MDLPASVGFHPEAIVSVAPSVSAADGEVRRVERGPFADDHPVGPVALERGTLEGDARPREHLQPPAAARDVVAGVADDEVASREDNTFFDAHADAHRRVYHDRI